MLWEHGTLGVEVGNVDAVGNLSLDAYFPVGHPLPEVGAAWVERGVRREFAESLPDADWLAPYRARTVPFAVGKSFFIDPRDPADDPPPAAAKVPPGRTLLRLPAREAFGVGSHETTRLTLMLLEDAACRPLAGVPSADAPLAGSRVLDVGTGTGILAFAALALGAAAVTAFDIDPIAVFHARHNAALNASHLPGASTGRSPFVLFAGTVGALEPTPWDLLLINVLPERIGPDLDFLVRSLRRGGELLLSGLLVEQEAESRPALDGLGLVEVARRVEGEWLGLRLRKEAA